MSSRAGQWRAIHAASARAASSGRIPVTTIVGSRSGGAGSAPAGMPAARNSNEKSGAFIPVPLFFRDYSMGIEFRMNNGAGFGASADECRKVRGCERRGAEEALVERAAFLGEQAQ